MELVFFLLDLVDLFGDAIWSALRKGGKLVFAYLGDSVAEAASGLPVASFLQFPAFSGNTWDTALGWLNWVFPVQQLETALLAYAGAVFAYYVFTRIRKAMED